MGRELFERVWVKNDPRSHGGDGLGPVFNGQSCVACHNLGGSGGAGQVDTNIEIATVTGTPGEGMGYFYSFSMDFGAGRFEYRMGGDLQATRVAGPTPSRHSWPEFIRDFATPTAPSCTVMGPIPHTRHGAGRCPVDTGRS